MALYTGVPSRVFAQVVWDGDAATGAWSTGSNWDTGSLPTSTDLAVFDAADANSQYSITLGANRTVLGVQFDATGSNGFTFNGGNALTTKGSGIVNNNSQTQTFDSEVRTSGTQTWAATTGGVTFDEVRLASHLTLTGGNAIDIDGALTNYGGNRNLTNNLTTDLTIHDVYLSNNASNRRLSILGSGDTVITGVLSGASGAAGAGRLTKNGTGDLTLSASAGTYTGQTILQGAGTTFMGHNASFGTGELVLNGGTLDDGGAARTIVNATRLNGNSTLSGSNGFEFTDTFTISNSRTLYVNNTGTNKINDVALSNNTVARKFTVGGTEDITIAGVISDGVAGDGKMGKTGTGTLTLEGTNTYTGVTTIGGGGTVVLGNNAAFGTGQVNFGTNTLQGDGTARTIANTSQLTGTMTLGGSSDLTLSGNMTLTGSRSLYAENTGTSIISGDIALSNSSTNRTLTIRGSEDLTISGDISNGLSSTASKLTKNDDGTVTLSGDNSYGGITDMNAGTLILTGDNTTTGDFQFDNGTVIAGSDTAFGTSLIKLKNGSFEGSGGARTFANEVQLVGSGMTLAGSSDLTFTGTMTGTSSRTLYVTNTGATTLGDIDISASVTNRTLTVNNSTDLTIAGVISNGLSTTSNLYKKGAGTLTLTGTNTYSGNTYLYDGTIEISDESKLGSNPTSYSTSRLRFHGGTLRNTADVTIDDANRGIYVSTGGGTFETSAGTTLTINNIVGGSNGQSLTKTGTGTLVFAGDNTFSGDAVVSAGKLTLAHNDSLGNTTGDTTVASGATLSLTNDITISGEDLALSGALENTSGTNTFGGDISGSGTVSVVADQLTLSGANTYSGLTTVSSGTLVAAHNSALGANTANAIVNSGGTISLDGGVTVTKTSGTLSLNSSGASASTGALHAGGNTGTTSEWIGNIALTGDSTISAADNLLTIGDISTLADTLDLGSYTLTLNTPDSPNVTPVYMPYPSYPLDPTNILINSVISGSGGLTKTGSGTATLLSGNKNTFTGDTAITGGKLIVDGSGFYNSPVISSSNVTIGNASGAGSADSVILQMGQLSSPGAGFPTGVGFIGTYDSGTLTASTALTIYEDGLFDMNGGENAFSGITLKGGHITGRDPSSSPLLTIAGDVTTLASSQTALIEEGEVGMSKNGFTFNIADGAAAVDLQVDSILHNGIGYTASTTSTINKTGAGTMVLTGTNDYVGITQVQQGILNIQNNTALGQSSTGNSTGNGTVVSSGAQLQLESGLTVGNETLSLSGTGVSNTGALLNQADDNTYHGYIHLDADARINANAGTTLNIASTSGVNAGILNGASAGKNLTVGGSGDTIINGSIGSFVTNITKDGSGTLTLAGYNGYAGATHVTSGAVKIIHDNGLSGTGANVTSGAALQFAQDATNADIDVVGVNATINGTGLSNGGAIQNLNSDNSYLGAVTLGSDSRITAEAGSSLTLNGNVNAAGHNLDAGGAGDTTYNGIISGSGSGVTKTDTGTVTIGGTSANTFTGGLNVNEGTVNLNKTAGVNAIAGGTVTVGDSSGSANSANLVVQANNQMADSTDLALNSDGRIQMGTAEDAISTIAGTGQIDLGGSGRLIIGDDNSSSTFGGSITSDDINGTLEKNGSGTLTLTSDISYDGTLELGGGTLKLSDIDLTVGSLVITADTTIDFSGVSTLNVGAFSFLSTSYTLSIINWDKNVDFFYSSAWTGGVQDTTGILPMNQVVFDGFLGDQTIWDSYDDEIYPTIPEPSSYGMIFFGAAAALVGFKRRRDRRKATRGRVN